MIRITVTVILKDEHTISELLNPDDSTIIVFIEVFFFNVVTITIMFITRIAITS